MYIYSKRGTYVASRFLLKNIFTFWKEPWFAGGFVWKWFHRHEKVGGKDNPMFTPQNKPAENEIRAYYKTE